MPNLNSVGTPDVNKRVASEQADRTKPKPRTVSAAPQRTRGTFANRSTPGLRGPGPDRSRFANQYSGQRQMAQPQPSTGNTNPGGGGFMGFDNYGMPIMGDIPQGPQHSPSNPNVPWGGAGAPQPSPDRTQAGWATGAGMRPARPDLGQMPMAPPVRQVAAPAPMPQPMPVRPTRQMAVPQGYQYSPQVRPPVQPWGNTAPQVSPWGNQQQFDPYNRWRR